MLNLRGQLLPGIADAGAMGCSSKAKEKGSVTSRTGQSNETPRSEVGLFVLLPKKRNEEKISQKKKSNKRAIALTG